MSNTCDLCKKSSSGVVSISRDGTDGVQFIYKLSDCIPEIRWDPNHLICTACQEKTHLTHDFKKQCVSSLSHITRFEELKASPDDEFICYHCERYFALKDDLIKHLASEHRSSKPKVPKEDEAEAVCKKSYSFGGDLRKHKKKPRFECDVCGKSYAFGSSLRQHKKLHGNHERRRFACAVCEKSYTRVEHLRRHERTHSGRTRVTCAVCRKSYASDYYLRLHKCERGLRGRYACDVCEKSYSYATDFRKHRKWHENGGRKPFGCTSCGKSYARAELLRRHERTHGEPRKSRNSPSLIKQCFEEEPTTVIGPETGIFEVKTEIKQEI